MEPDLTNPVTAAAVTGIVTAFLAWMTGKGWPVIEKLWDRVNGSRKVIRDEAKEGPLMVLQRVEQELARCQETLTAALSELHGIREKYFNCETEKAELRTEVKFLRSRLEDIAHE